MQLKEALVAAVERMESSDVGSPRLNAETLLMFVLGCNRAYLYAHPERELTDEEQSRYDEVLAQRARGVPSQYITGHQEFWGLDLVVSPAVLIPRPETEHLVETVLELARQVPHPKIVDIGTGSGCVALALAHELKDADVVGVDVSAETLEVARANAARLQLERVRFVQGDVLCIGGKACLPRQARDRLSTSLRSETAGSSTPLRCGRNDEVGGLRSGRNDEMGEGSGWNDDEAGSSTPLRCGRNDELGEVRSGRDDELAEVRSGRHDELEGLRSGRNDGGAEARGFRNLDFVVSNPPYVGLDEADKVQRSVKEFEPTEAVFAGEHGLDVIRPLIHQAHDALKTGGWLAMEIGYSMRDAVLQLLSPTMWDETRVVPDLQGIPRVIAARKK